MALTDGDEPLTPADKIIKLDDKQGLEEFYKMIAAPVIDPITGELVDFTAQAGGRSSTSTRESPIRRSLAEPEVEPLEGLNEPKDGLAANRRKTEESMGSALERAHELVRVIARCDIDFELPGGVSIKAREGEWLTVERWIADELRKRAWVVLAEEASEEAWKKTIAMLLPEARDWVRWLLSGRTDNNLDVATPDYVAGFLARKLRISDELARALIEHMVERGDLVQDEAGLLRLRPR